ncbi:MAG: UDP-galactopyranose mutase [Armatimonadetes bacterium]|nr:UDP-galactopyranose mutase [Armatimonadota bacterium]
MSRYDFLVVGAGLAGATFARAAAEAGRRVLVMERRGHVAGNCHTPEREGILVHQHGPHLFHTSSRAVWEWVTRFAAFVPYRHRALSRVGDRLYSFPINLLTLYQLWGVTTPAEAAARLAQERIPCERPRNLEEWALSQVGREIYETFFAGYTAKQWGRDPADLPASLVRRLPVRLTHDDSYFPDRDVYQGVPAGGYTAMVEAMLDAPGVEVQLSVDFLEERSRAEALAGQVVYTGSLDSLGGHRQGYLGYRSLRFEHTVLEGDFQGAGQVNYPARDVPWTRITEHKHLGQSSAGRGGVSGERTVITREYPQSYDGDNEPYYPLADAENRARAARYRADAEAQGYLLLGRLARYQYMDMDVVVGQSLAVASRLLGRTGF